MLGAAAEEQTVLQPRGVQVSPSGVNPIFSPLGDISKPTKHLREADSQSRFLDTQTPCPTKGLVVATELRKAGFRRGPLGLMERARLAVLSLA